MGKGEEHRLSAEDYDADLDDPNDEVTGFENDAEAGPEDSEAEADDYRDPDEHVGGEGGR